MACVSRTGTEDPGEAGVLTPRTRLLQLHESVCPGVEGVALRVPCRHVAHLTWPPASMTNLNHRTAGGNGAGQGRCRRRFTATLPITGYTDTWRDHQCLVPGILKMESIKGRIRRGIYNCKTHGWRSSQKMVPGT